MKYSHLPRITEPAPLCACNCGLLATSNTLTKRWNLYHRYHSNRVNGKKGNTRNTKGRETTCGIREKKGPSL